MIVLSGRRFGDSSPLQLPRLLRVLTAVFSKDVDDMIDTARDRDWERHRRFCQRWADRLLDVSNTKLEVVGLEHVDANETYVIASLHEALPTHLR